MSTEVLEASPDSTNRNDPFSSNHQTNIFLKGGTSCGLSPILPVVRENDSIGHHPAMSAATLPSVIDSGGDPGPVHGGRKRHHSTSNPKPVGQIKRRRKTHERNGPVIKFLLGGSITDPLNLNSLDDEEISKIANAVTPACSPLPQIDKDPDPVIVPQDLKDPLKLNSAEDNEESNSSLTKTLLPRKSSGKKKKNHSGDAKRESIDSSGIPDKNEESPSLRPYRLDIVSSKTANARFSDKIVSPVLPDARTRKRKPSRAEPSSRLAKALLIDDLKPLPRSIEIEPKKARKSPDVLKTKRQHSHEGKQQVKTLPKFREQDKKFQYGNYARYYGYRNPDSDDGRINLFKKDWFEGKKCLDIGCNSGHITLAIGKLFDPKQIVGVDIDGHLIGVARKNIRNCLEDQFREKIGKPKGKEQFPISMAKSYGPIAVPPPEGNSSSVPVKGKPSTTSFPANVLFRCANFVLESDALLSTQREEYDTILCLSVTKWVHLNWGDAGMKRFFQRIFRALRPGGRLILEPQAWPSYHKKRKTTETTFRNYEQIRFKPHQFKDFLLSQEVGFASCEVIGTPLNKSKGFRRPILMFTKLAGSRPVSRLPSPSSTPNSTSTPKPQDHAPPSKRSDVKGHETSESSSSRDRRTGHKRAHDHHHERERDAKKAKVATDEGGKTDSKHAHRDREKNEKNEKVTVEGSKSSAVDVRRKESKQDDYDGQRSTKRAKVASAEGTTSAVERGEESSCHGDHSGERKAKRSKIISTEETGSAVESGDGVNTRRDAERKEKEGRVDSTSETPGDAVIMTTGVVIKKEDEKEEDVEKDEVKKDVKKEEVNEIVSDDVAMTTKEMKQEDVENEGGNSQGGLENREATLPDAVAMATQETSKEEKVSEDCKSSGEASVAKDFKKEEEDDEQKSVEKSGSVAKT